MRSNGLTADDYAPLAELDRSVAADALLALREAGVAAYVVLPDDEPGRHATVFADRAALERARLVLRDLAPDALAGQGQGVDEEVWAQIVAGFTSTASEPDLGRRPPAGDQPGRTGDRPREPGSGDDRPPRGPEPPGRHPLVRDDDEDHFVPEPPPPPPSIDLVSRLAWAGVIGGPLALLLAALLSWTPPRALVLLCVLGFVGGMVTLVLRMKDRPPTDDGPDDGAVV